MEGASIKLQCEDEHPEKLPDGTELHKKEPSEEEEGEKEGDQEATIEKGDRTEDSAPVESMEATENLDLSKTVETSEVEETQISVDPSDILEPSEPEDTSPGNVGKSASLKPSGNVEHQEENLTLNKDDKTTQMHGNVNKERNVLVGRKSNDVELTHTEVDLTRDLETQRLIGMCRVCAKSKMKLYPVFGTPRNILEKIHTFLPILVTPDDLLPVKVCSQCLASLDQSQRLVETCLAADKTLRSLLETKLTFGADVELKAEREDVNDDYDDHSMGYDDEPDRPPSPFTPLSSDNLSMGAVSPKREVITPEPILSAQKDRTKSGENLSRRSELDLLRGALSTTNSPNILKKRRTRQTSQECLSPTILEKMRSYGIKESSVVMTKVDIPEDSHTAVVTTVSVPIAKEKPKNRAGPKRLYRCLYCSETGSDAYKLLLHQMKMHPGNLLKCPHCGFVCGSDQKAKFDAHVLAHTVPGKPQQAKKLPELVAIATKEARPLLPRPDGMHQFVSTPAGNRKGSAQAKSGNKKSLIKPNILPKKGMKGPVPLATPVVTQIPGNAIMLRIQVDGQPGADGSAPAPTAIVPVTLYQCARCRLNFNSKEAVEKHICVLPSNLIPVALTPGEKLPIPPLKAGTPIPISLKPVEPVPISSKLGEPIAIAPRRAELIPIALKPGEPIPIAPKPGDIEFTCSTCGIHFADAALLREHVLTHYQVYKCNHCNSSFRSEFQLRQHQKKHNPEKREYKCPHCPKVYNVKARLKVHLYSHSNTPRCVCPQCGKVFRTDGGYRNHIKAHENKRAFACSVCGLRFNRRGNMLRHERNCDGKKTLHCAFCPATFDQKFELQEHRSSVHSDIDFSVPIPEASTGDKEKKYACKVCSEGFRRVVELRRHQLMHTDEELNAVKDVPDGGAYLCHTCGKQIHHLHNYKLHLMHHQGKALFRCDQCDKPFTSKFALNYHHMLHTGDFPFKCSLCTESFRTSVALEVHRYKHTGEKPYRCKLCEMGFFTKHSLRLHQTVHSSERNYVCRVCGSTFKRRKTLRYHMLIHTGEKPHTCRICGKSFRQKGTCTIHERNHELATKRPKTSSATNRRPRPRLRPSRQSRRMDDSEDEDIDEMENVILEEVVEDDMEDERAAQMMEMEIEDETEAAGQQSQARVWRIADSKVPYRLRNMEWKQPTTSDDSDTVYVLRGPEGAKEELPSVCRVQSEVIEGEFLSMYPEMQEIVAGEKTSIEFTTSDGTIRILR